MRTKTLYAYVFCIALQITISASAQQISDIPTPDGKQWNLISTPCDVSVDELKPALGNDEIRVFSWNGNEYAETTAMKRGVGYLLNKNAVLNSSMVCGGTKDDTMSMSLKKGWNLVGNPYHKAVSFKVVFDGLADKITTIIEFKGNKYSELQISNKMVPFNGYWINYDGEDVIADDGTNNSSGETGENEEDPTDEVTDNPEDVESPVINDIAVTFAYYDDIGAILTKMGYKYDVISRSSVSEFMKSTEQLSQYKTVFINCGYGYGEIGTAQASALTEYVNNGGELYVSDWGFNYLYNAFPDKISYYPYVGDGGIFSAQVTDPGLLAYLDDKDTTSIYYNYSEWVPIKSISDDVKSYIKNSRYGHLMVSFNYGKGKVIYTTFHNEANISNDVEQILKYMVLIPITGNMATQNEQLLSQECDQCGVSGEYLNSLGLGEEVTVEFTPGENGGNVIIVNGEGEFEIEIYAPDGTLYNPPSDSEESDGNTSSASRQLGRTVQKETDDGNVTLIKLPDDAPISEGKWKYKIKNKNADANKKPVVVTIGSKEEEN